MITSEELSIISIGYDNIPPSERLVTGNDDRDAENLSIEIF